MKKARKRPWLSWDAWLLLSVGLLVVASLRLHSGGWLHREADMYLVDHLSDRSFVSKILCPNAADALYHQGRPLGHLLEFLDAHVIYCCTLLGRPHFLSTTNYVLLIAVTFAHWHWSRKLLNLDPGIVMLAVLLFWSSPAIFFSGVYFRSAKPGVALLSTLLIWRLVRVFRDSKAPASHARAMSKWEWMASLVLGLALCLMDPQGVYLVIGCILTLAGMAWAGDMRRIMVVAGALTTALCLYQVWYWAISPPLIGLVNGFELSFDYPRARWQLLFESTWMFWLSFYLMEGATLTLDSVRFYLGSISRVLAAGVLGFAGYLFHTTTPVTARRCLPRSGVGALAIALWFGLVVAMNILMVSQHPLLQMEDFRRTGPHRIPATVLVLFGVTFLAHRLLATGLLSKNVLRGIAAVLLLSNLAALPTHYAVDRNGWFKAYQDAAPRMMIALRELVRAPRGSGTGKHYDFSINAHSTAKRMLRAGPDLLGDEDDYVRSSHYYNFLCSEFGLPFVQE